MYIELATPASLPLGLVKVGDRLCLLGLTIQHPQVQVWAESQEQMNVTGPRAHIGADQADRYRDNTGISEQAAIEIEETIPAFVGLGSDAHMALGIARALAWIAGHAPDDVLSLAKNAGLSKAHALEIWGHQAGGVLLIDLEKAMEGEDAVLVRETVAHADKESWAFVMHFPNIPFDTPDTYEAEITADVLGSAKHLDGPRSAAASDAIFQAIRADDIRAFAAAVVELQQVNRAAQSAAGTHRPDTDEVENVRDQFKKVGCIMIGDSLFGDTVFGLVQSGNASRDVRVAMNKALGIFAGTTMATIVDNRGAAQSERAGNLKLKELDPYRFLNNSE
jgi:predicted sugar kinase